MAQEQVSTMLEFQDSEVATIAVDGATVLVKFSAASIRRDLDGREEASGYMKSLELVCSGGSVLHHDPACIGRISAGLLTVGGQAMKRVAIPYQAMGHTALELTFTNGSRFHARSTSVVLRVAGEGKFMESFSC